MAERDDENIVLEVPRYADKITFVEDIVVFMLLRYSPNYQTKSDTSPFREHICRTFDAVTQQAVRFLDETLEMNHDDIFFKIKEIGCVNLYCYACFAENLAKNYFSDGFDANYFLVYCVNLSVIAAYFYNDGVLDAPEFAKEFIFCFIRPYDMASGGWSTVHRIAEVYAKLMQDSMSVLTPDSIDSNEIVPQNQEQDEVSGDELKNSTPNKEQDVLSENKENLEKQGESAYSENELSRKSASSSFESDSAIDANRFKQDSQNRIQDKASGENSPQNENQIVFSENVEQQESIYSEVGHSRASASCSFKINSDINSILFKPDFQNKAEDKASGVESRTSPQNRKQNILLENPEQQKNAYSETELSRKSASCSFKNNSEIDSSPFKELSSPSEDNPFSNLERSKFIKISGSQDGLIIGTSNIDEVAIRIKNDCKRKLELSWNEIKCRKIPMNDSEGNKSIDKSGLDDRFCPGPSSGYQKQAVFAESDCKGKLDMSLNTKNNEHIKTSNFEKDALIANILSDVESKKSSFMNIRDCIVKRYQKSYQKKEGNNPSTNYDESNLANKSPSTDKLIPKAPDGDQKSVISPKRKLENEESEANSQNAPLLDENEQPKLKDTAKLLKLERYNSSSGDEI